MLKLDRRQKITEHLQTHGSLRVSEAVNILQVSPATIRRDFALLTEEGWAERGHGGVAVGPKLRLKGWMPPYQARRMVQVAEKRRIAQAAASLLSPGDAIFIDGGTTTMHLAPFLPSGVRVITHSVILAVALDESATPERSLEVYLAGGFMHPNTGLLVGPQALETIRNYHARWALISAGGVCTDGVTNNVEQEVDIEKAMIQNADKVVILADHTKIGVRAMVRMCRLHEVDLIITDREAPAEALAEIRNAGLTCEVMHV